MSAIPTFMSNTGEVTCADHAGRYLTAALNKRPDLKTTKTPLDAWKRVDGDVYRCDHCVASTRSEMCDMCDERTTHVNNQCQQCGHQVAIIRSAVTTTPSKENNMTIAIATPVRKTRKPAAKKTTPAKTTAKKETPVTVAVKKPAAKKPVAKKTVAKKTPVAKKAAPAAKVTVKKAPAKKSTPAETLFLVYRDITNDVPAAKRRAKSFDPTRYEGVLAGKGIADARKNLEALKGDEYGQYEVMPSFDQKFLSQSALAKFDTAVERVVNVAKNTYRVTLKDVDGLSENETNGLALFGAIVKVGAKHPENGNENLMDHGFTYVQKATKDGKTLVTITGK